MLLLPLVGCEALTVAPMTMQRDRLTVVGDLLAQLPSGSRRALVPGDEAFSLIDELELLKFTPPLPSLLYFGLDGQWELRAWSESLDAPIDAETLSDIACATVSVLGCEQVIDGTEVSTAAEFELVDEQLRGSLTTVARLDMTDRPDTCNFFMEEPRLSLPRMPTSVEIGTLMEALHAQLGPETRTAGGVRLGMQTTYMDENVRITRCLTRELAGATTIYVRRDSA